MKINLRNIEVNTDKIVLSSKSCVYKSESLIKQTKYISNVDFFLSKISEAIMQNLNKLEVSYHQDNYFKVETIDHQYAFLFKIARNIKNEDSSNNDIIFFSYESGGESIRQNDQRVIKYLKENKKFRINIESIIKHVEKRVFDKLYVLSNGSNINLPLLNKEQKKIVEIMDENVVVQGVAGSGKTNVCIDKLIFSACRNYSGKILYTTYSRGLLNNTRLKIEAYKNELVDFVKKYENMDVKFLDNNHKQALENKFGIYFFSEDDDKIVAKMNYIINFLESRVDYFLIDDIYKKYFQEKVKFVGENYFIHDYIKTLKNHQIKKELSKLEQYSNEIIYKEIYGIIFGFYDENRPLEIISLQDYIEKRKDSFSTNDCKSIYLIAKDYKEHCEDYNLIDINLASKKLLGILPKIDKYSLAIVDEVQDYTQVNLNLIKQISLKVFCVGDALQMINPSYFSFGYLKNLLYEKDIISVAELKNNYRNTKKIEEIIDDLGSVNIKLFGTHNFVLKGNAVESDIKTTTVYTKDSKFIDRVAKGKYDNFTIVVASNNQKEELRKVIKNQEVLTISEIKGLERDTVVLYNILSDNLSKWQRLERISVNRKQADENSIYRYYFNLFYVGISRAKQNLFVVENSSISLFENLFKSRFVNLDINGAIGKLNNIVSKLEFSQDELIARVGEFIGLEQYDNATFTANKISDDKLRLQELNRIEVSKVYISTGNYRDAGIKFWELGMMEDAKQQFVLSHDESLIKLIEACENNSKTSQLNVDIVEYYDDVKGNDVARNLILDTLKKDIQNLKFGFRNILDDFNREKEHKHGKQK